MKVREPWLNGATSLFWTCEEGTCFLDCVQVDEISWTDANHAKVKLTGYLPETSRFLERFRLGDSLYLRYNECEPRDDWDNGCLIMQFLNCKVIQKKIELPLTLRPPSDSITYQMEIEADFSLPVGKS